MGAVEVVVMQPVFELFFSFSRVLIASRVGPLAQGGLDETLGLAVGARRVGARKSLFEMEFVHELVIEPVAIAGAVIAVDAANGDAEAAEVGAGHEEETDRRLMALIGQDGREADARVVVDGDVQILVADAARLLAENAGDAMPGLVEPRQALDVEVDQVAGVLVFVALDRWRRIKRAQAIHPGAAQNAADGGAAELEFSGDAPAVPAQPAKSKNLF